MATFICRVQFLDDTDPFNSTNFPEPTRPPLYTFREDIPLINQIAGVHRLLKAPHKPDDCALQLSHNGSYLDLESTLAEQRDELEGFQEDGGRGKKHSIILRTQLSVRVHCLETTAVMNGHKINKMFEFIILDIFLFLCCQDDKDLVHEFVVAEGLTCLIKVGAEADQNYQNYILRALGQIMLYVDGMNGLISHNETIQWLYTLVGSKFRLVVKTSLKLLLVFVEYTESNAALLIKAVNAVDTKRGTKLWSNVMEILDEKDGVDTELLVFAMTLINKTLAGLPDQDSYYDMVDCLEEQGIEATAQRHLSRKGTDLDLVEQFNIYEMTLRHEDGDDDTQLPPSGRKDRRRASVGGTNERRGLERRRSRRHSLQNSRGHASAPASPCTSHARASGFLRFGSQHEDISESLICSFSLIHRPAIGGLLTLSYKQHQESLAAERERRRQEREERLQRIEREERNRFRLPDVEAEVELEEESEKEQVTERDADDSVLLSEKERQNEEVNEKDNCSASSISSTSSTLEREEREVKLNRDIEAGQWTQCIKEADVNDHCNKILNGKRFMLDMLYAQKTAAEDDGQVGESEKEKCKCEKEEVNDSVASLASRISTLEAHRQAREENVKKMEVGNLDNQGSVRAVAGKFGNLVKGLTSPPEAETSKEQQQAEKSSPAASSALAPKKESDYIWDQLMAKPRELRIKDMDFTDLKDEDDMDILDMDSTTGSGDLIPPLPPLLCNTALPPPPPLFGCPPPPPILGKMMPPPPPFMAPIPPPSPQLSRGDIPLFQKKKKTIRLFWNEVRPVDWQCKSHKFCKESLWSKLEPITLDTSKLEQLFESKSKELSVTKKAAVDGKRQEIIVLDSKRSNAINIGLTVLPPPRTIKTAILNFDEYALNKEGIEKILTMIPTEEEKQKIQEAQLVNPAIPLGSAEQFLLTLSSITELSARLQLWAFKMDYEIIEKEVAEPLQDLKEGMDQLEKNKTLGYILTTLLAIGNFLNGSNAKGFELNYLEKVPEVKDTVHKQSLLHHACSIVVEKFPDSTDLYSEIGAVTRLTKVDFDQLQDNLAQMERRCKASWDHLKVIAKHEMKPALKQKMSDFLKDCAERIIILKIVHRRIINRFHAFLLFLGHPVYAVRDVSIHRFSKILSEFALEYRTTRERVLQQKQKRANHRERNKTRGKMITDSGKFGGAPSDKPESQPQSIQSAEDAAEHENMKAVLKSSLQGKDSGTSTVPGLRTRTRASRVAPWCSVNDDPINCTDDTADEIMERIVRSATQGPSQRTQPRERRRSRANRKSLRRTLRNGLTTEEANALGLSNGSEMQV
uniref:Formin homology 2 domain containing 3 n=1 Tax=Oreochromis niloticus TaxID=8128 RepID=A0A669EEQ7_ORENI